RWRIVLVTIPVLGLIGWLGGAWLARTVRDRSQEIGAQFCGPDSRISIGKVKVDLFSGDVEWTDIRIEQDVDSGDTTWTSDRHVLISGSVDSISVRGAALLRLAFGHTLRVRSLTIARPRLIFLMGNRADSLAVMEDNEARITTLELDSLVVQNGSVYSQNVERRSSIASIGNVELRSTDLRCTLPEGDTPLHLELGGLEMALDTIAISLPPLYDLRVDRFELSNALRSARGTSVALVPRNSPQEYHTLIELETDLFALHTDTISLSGFDLAEAINTSSFQPAWMRVAGTELAAFRDKNMPDAPFKHKGLPARLLRAIPFGVRMDSLVVDSLNVRYQEKNDMSPDFGEVTFTNIHGVVTGLNTITGEDTGQVHLMATGHVFEQAAVTFDFVTSQRDSSDRFTARATISGLPFQVFNRMTDDLLNVKATAGTIGGMDLTFTGDDRNGSGRLDMEYAGLVVKVQSRDGERRAKRFLSGLVNTILRDENLRSSEKFRHGDFTVDRRRDRAIFNYLWRAVRTGMLATVLPDVVSSSTKDKKEK
ncbi:MAG: hypothetical protein WAU70_14880, partial [Flavobacteriales bacterium]